MSNKLNEFHEVRTSPVRTSGAMTEEFGAEDFTQPVDPYWDHPGWNQSSAVELLNKSPRHAWEKRNRKRDTADPDHSREREMGRVIHLMLLGATERYKVLEFKDYRTNAAKEARAECERTQVIPILEVDMSRCRRTVAAVQEQLEAFGVKMDGESEVPFYWSERELLVKGKTHSLSCKARIDHICADGLTVLDIKSGEEANPRRLVRRILECGYDVQAAAYLRALYDKYPERQGRARFIDVFIETDGLALCTPLQIAGSLLELGESKWLRSCRRWVECVDAATYPGYTDRILQPEAPPWALTEEMSL